MRYLNKGQENKKRDGESKKPISSSFSPPATPRPTDRPNEKTPRTPHAYPYGYKNNGKIYVCVRIPITKSSIPHGRNVFLEFLKGRDNVREPYGYSIFF